MTTPARRYMAERAIDPRIAHDLGVTLDGDYLVFPSGKRRRVKGEGPKFLNPKGKQLPLWWLQRPTSWIVCLVCEGESDALAAVTALRSSPREAGLRDLPVLCSPGVGAVERVAEELADYRTAFIAFDPDEAGRNATSRLFDLLVTRAVRPVDVGSPLDPCDLAEFLVASENPGEDIANLLHDADLSAPRLNQLALRRKARKLREEADRLEAEAA